MSQQAHTKLHPMAFQSADPTGDQIDRIRQLRDAAEHYSRVITEVVPDGADKTYSLRKLREVAMWVSTAMTHHADGSPRKE